jgi:hypothetical protein
VLARTMVECLLHVIESLWFSWNARNRLHALVDLDIWHAFVWSC